jgi:hypothetical protein
MAENRAEIFFSLKIKNNQISNVKKHILISSFYQPKGKQSDGTEVFSYRQENSKL